MTTSELPGLIGWWPLHDLDGMTDCFGRALRAGYGVSAVSHTRPSNRLELRHSLYFPRGTYAAIPDAPNVETGDFSVCLWAKTSGYSREVQVLLDKRIEVSGSVRGWAVFLYDWNLCFQMADGNLSNHHTPTRLPTDGNWHHLAITIDRDQSTGGQWYIDGAAVGEPFDVRDRSGSLSNAIALTLGQRSRSSGGDFQGYLSDLHLYQRALTAEEIYQVYGAIGADEPTSRSLVTPPPVVSPAALQVENDEPLPLLDGIPLIEITPESATEMQPQPSPAIDDDWTDSEKQAYEAARQDILNCSETETTLSLTWSGLRMLPSEIGQLQNLHYLRGRLRSRSGRKKAHSV